MAQADSKSTTSKPRRTPATPHADRTSEARDAMDIADARFTQAEASLTAIRTMFLVQEKDMRHPLEPAHLVSALWAVQELIEQAHAAYDLVCHAKKQHGENI